MTTRLVTGMPPADANTLLETFFNTRVLGLPKLQAWAERTGVTLAALKEAWLCADGHDIMYRHVEKQSSLSAMPCASRHLQYPCGACADLVRSWCPSFLALVTPDEQAVLEGRRAMSIESAVHCLLLAVPRCAWRRIDANGATETCLNAATQSRPATAEFPLEILACDRHANAGSGFADLTVASAVRRAVAWIAEQDRR